SPCPPPGRMGSRGRDAAGLISSGLAPVSHLCLAWSRACHERPSVPFSALRLFSSYACSPCCGRLRPFDFSPFPYAENAAEQKQRGGGAAGEAHKGGDSQGGEAIVVGERHGDERGGRDHGGHPRGAPRAPEHKRQRAASFFL